MTRSLKGLLETGAGAAPAPPSVEQLRVRARTMRRRRDAVRMALFAVVALLVALPIGRVLVENREQVLLDGGPAAEVLEVFETPRVTPADGLPARMAGERWHRATQVEDTTFFVGAHGDGRVCVLALRGGDGPESCGLHNWMLDARSGGGSY